MNFSTNVRQLRELHNMSQAELANGICSQGLISKIENGSVVPDISIMVGIADKFNLTVSQLIGQSSAGDIFSYIQKVIRELVDYRQYAQLKEFLSKINYAILSNKPNFKMWVDAIILNEVEGRSQEAIELLKKAMRVNQFDNVEQGVRIYSALGSIHLGTKQFKEAAFYYKKAFDMQETREIDNYLKRKLLYNMGIAYYQLDDYSQSIFYSRLALCSVIQASTLYLLDDLHLLLADNYVNLKAWEKAWENILRAEVVANIKGNQSLLPYIEQTKNEIFVHK